MTLLPKTVLEVYSVGGNIVSLDSKMRLLELFSGTGSVGRVFSEAGWEVISVDMDPSSGATHVADILVWSYQMTNKKNRKKKILDYI